jgi:hypothetical protein
MCNVEKTRREFKPDSIATLFVGESAPHGGTFFYKEDSILFNAMKNAFTEARQELFEGKGVFLKHFQDCGFYLDDLADEPINHLPPPSRRAKRISGIPKLAERIKCYRPKEIVIIMCAIRRNVVQAIREAGLDYEPSLHCLAFPAMGHQPRFHKEMLEIIQTLPCTKENNRRKKHP